MVCTNHENRKNTKCILQRIIIIARKFLFAQFHSTASYLFRARQSLRQQHVTQAHCKRVTVVSDISSVFTATVRAYGVIGFPFARQQFANSCMVAMSTACKLFVLLVCIVLFQTTKPRNIRTIKKFSWVSWTTKLILCKNFITPKFPRELQLIINTLPWLLQC